VCTFAQQQPKDVERVKRQVPMKNLQPVEGFTNARETGNSNSRFIGLFARIIA